MEKVPEPKTWAGVVATNEPMTDLESIDPGMSMKFNRGECDEGNMIWKHAVIGVHSTDSC